MQMGMGEILNSTEEMARMADYPMIRMYSVQLTTSENPMDDLVKENPFQKTSWARTTDTFPADPNKPLITYFSAVCLLYATNIADVYGRDKVFGLIESNWGGTIIEAWMPPEPLDACGIEPCCENGDQNSNSIIYNAMIHPLISLSIKGALWYQGRHTCPSRWPNGGGQFSTRRTFQKNFRGRKIFFAQFRGGKLHFP